jgi:hypothetical protein
VRQYGVHLLLAGCEGGRHLFFSNSDFHTQGFEVLTAVVRIRDSSVGIATATGWTTEGSEFEYR